MNRHERRAQMSTAGIRVQQEANKVMRDNVVKSGTFVTMDYRAPVTVEHMMFGMVADWVEANTKGKSMVRWQHGETYPEYAFELEADCDAFNTRWGKSETKIVSEDSKDATS